MMTMDMDFEKPIIAVTGSAGKTMVKTMIASILSEQWVIFESKDYYNTFQHSGDHAKQISHIHRAAVLEYGMAFPGAIMKHCGFIKPNIGVITNVLSSHIGNFGGDIRKLIRAKSELINGMEQNGMLFINADDINSKWLHKNHFEGDLITVGIKSKADYKAIDIKMHDTKTRFSIMLDGIKQQFVIPTIGIHNIYNALFSIAVSHNLGFDPKTIQAGLEKMKKPNHRLNIVKLKDDIKVIDDTVHASPDAMKAAIDVLKQTKGRKKIAVLGTMTELGPNSKEYHEDVGQYLSSKNIDRIYTYGGYSVNIGIGAVNHGLDKQCLKHFRETEIDALYDELKREIRPKDVVLVKGASGLHMYKIVQYLKKKYKFK